MSTAAVPVPFAPWWLRTLRSAFERLFLDQQLDFWLRELNPAWSLFETHAQLVDIIDETPDTKTFVLQPSPRWAGHRAGQYVPITVRIDGKRVTRCYSLSSAPTSERLTLTVKRVLGGRVSNWLHDHLSVGDDLILGDAAGDFIVPESVPAPVLLIAGGSGITPILSILDELAAQRRLDGVELVYYARTANDVIAEARLQALVEAHPGFRLHLCLDEDASTPRGFDGEHLRMLVPDFAARDAWLCGPAGLMDVVQAFWKANGAEERLRMEQFTASPVAPRERSGEPSPVSVELLRAARVLAGDDDRTLLEQLEAAGERPAFGCRMGICHSCRCTKVSGAVENRLTGELSTEPNESIQLCISVPRGDVALNA